MAVLGGAAVFYERGTPVVQAVGLLVRGQLIHRNFVWIFCRKFTLCRRNAVKAVFASAGRENDQKVPKVDFWCQHRQILALFHSLRTADRCKRKPRELALQIPGNERKKWARHICMLVALLPTKFLALIGLYGEPSFTQAALESAHEMG